MNPDEIIGQAIRAGLKLIIKGDQLTVQGTGTRPIQLLEAIRSNKSQIVSRLLDQTQLLSQGSQQSEERPEPARGVPRTDLTLPEVLPALSIEHQRLLIETVLNQGKPAIGWCLTRANAYWLKFPSSTWIQQDAAAANDLLRWQADTHTVGHGMGQFPK